MSASPPRPTLRVVGDDEEPRAPRASLLLRAGARLVDLALAWALYLSTGPAGVVMALLYLLFADGMLRGQSAGKRMFGIKVLYLPARTGARYRDSVLRNAPLGLVVILSMMPGLGFTAFIAGALVIGGVESVRCWRDPAGQRLGDLWAQTQVVDGKVPFGQAEFATPREEARASARLRVLHRARSPDEAP